MAVIGATAAAWSTSRRGHAALVALADVDDGRRFARELVFSRNFQAQGVR